jgi:mannose/fructose/N-acetylgalactosamine-specific phosphotransferase system component IIC
MITISYRTIAVTFNKAVIASISNDATSISQLSIGYAWLYALLMIVLSAACILFGASKVIPAVDDLWRNLSQAIEVIESPIVFFSPSPLMGS